jgi:hypothetical protein
MTGRVRPGVTGCVPESDPLCPTFVRQDTTIGPGNNVPMESGQLLPSGSSQGPPKRLTTKGYKNMRQRVSREPREVPLNGRNPTQKWNSNRSTDEKETDQIAQNWRSRTVCYSTLDCLQFKRQKLNSLKQIMYAGEK